MSRGNLRKSEILFLTISPIIGIVLVRFGIPVKHPIVTTRHRVIVLLLRFVTAVDDGLLEVVEVFR